MPYTLIIQAHAVPLMVALGLFLVAEILLFAARSGRARLAGAALISRTAGEALAGLGMLVGIGLVIVGGWSLLTSWLIASFVLIALFGVVGGRLVKPWEVRLKSALRDSGSGSDIGSLAGENRALLGRLVTIGLFVLIMGLMSAKPDLSLPM